MAKNQIERTPNGAQFTVTDSDYKKAEKAGKVFSGFPPVLVMEIGQKTGPWEVTNIENRKLDKRYDPVDVYTGECKGIRMALPAATSFRDKAKQAKLAVGSVILVERLADYRARGKDCDAYAIIVLK